MLRINSKNLIYLSLITSLASATTAIAEISNADEIGTFHIGIEANYLWQSQNTITEDGLANNSPPSFQVPLVNEPPSPNLGGGVDVAYIFPADRYGFTASYFFLRTKDTTQASNNGFQSGPFSSQSDLNYHFDAADILFNHYFKSDKRWLLRLGYGLGFVRIDQTSEGVLLTAPFQGVNNLNSGNKFTGVGPKITFSGDYKLFKRFYVVGDLGLSALYGESKSYLTLLNNDLNLGPNTTLPEKNYQFAFGFEGRAGLAYAMRVSEDIDVKLEGGFKALAYLNALNDDENTLTAGETPVVGQIFTGFDGTYSNFGPYINLSADF